MKMQSTLRVFFRKYSLLLGILYLLPCSLAGQKIYNQTFEFDHLQQNGQNVIELDSFYYVSGNLLEKEIPENERKAFIAKISKDLEDAEHFILEDADLYHTLNNPESLVLIGDYLYAHYLEEAFQANELLLDYNFILSYNLVTHEMKQHYVVTDSIFGNNGLFPNYLVATRLNELAYLNGYKDSTERKGILFQIVDTDFPSKVLQEYRKTVPGELWFPTRVVEDDTGYVLIGVRILDDNPDYAGLSLIKLNHSLEEEGIVLLDHLRFTPNVMDSAIDGDGNLIIIAAEFRIPDYTWRPRVIKLSPDLDIIWESPFSQSDYRDDTQFFLFVVESHNKDGYLIIF